MAKWVKEYLIPKKGGKVSKLRDETPITHIKEFRVLEFTPGYYVIATNKAALIEAIECIK